MLPPLSKLPANAAAGRLAGSTSATERQGAFIQEQPLLCGKKCSNRNVPTADGARSLVSGS